MTVIACATARNIQCKHIDAEVFFWVNLGPMMLPAETITSAEVSSADVNLIFSSPVIIDPEQIIYKDPECLIIHTIIPANQGVYFMISEGTVGLQTVKLLFEKSTGELDAINLLLRIVD